MRLKVGLERNCAGFVVKRTVENQFPWPVPGRAVQLSFTSGTVNRRQPNEAFVPEGMSRAGLEVPL